MATYYRQAQLEAGESDTLRRAASGSSVEAALTAVRSYLKPLRATAQEAAARGTLTPEQTARARQELAQRHALLQALEQQGVPDLDEEIQAHSAAMRVLDEIHSGHEDDSPLP